jgi:hypothetical protein
MDPYNLEMRPSMGIIYMVPTFALNFNGINFVLKLVELKEILHKFINFE